MRTPFFILAIILSCSCSYGQFQKVELQAAGLTCSMCSNAINKALKTIPFVETVSTDLEKNIFTVKFKDNSSVNFDAIREKVEGAGFSVAKFYVVARVNHLQIQNDQHSSISGTNFHFLHTKDQVVDGDQRFQVLDKGFVTAKEFKKNAVYTTMPCYQTGTMAACCKSPGDAKGVAASSRIYHVTI